MTFEQCSHLVRHPGLIVLLLLTPQMAEDLTGTEKIDLPRRRSKHSAALPASSEGGARPRSGIMHIGERIDKGKFSKASNKNENSREG
jgi:hypothetical protein